MFVAPPTTSFNAVNLGRWPVVVLFPLQPHVER